MIKDKKIPKRPNIKGINLIKKGKNSESATNKTVNNKSLDIYPKNIDPNIKIINIVEYNKVRGNSV